MGHQQDKACPLVEVSPSVNLTVILLSYNKLLLTYNEPLPSYNELLPSYNELLQSYNEPLLSLILKRAITSELTT